MTTTDLDCLELVRRVHPDFRVVWERAAPKDQIALVRYFLPKRSAKEVVEPTRPKVIKWYCPFAAQDVFPSGHRYCVNTYVGCSHNCVYCYANGYTMDRVCPKEGFEKRVDRDVADLEEFQVPAAPVHLSNSTDPLQEGLESRFKHTRYALEKMLTHRRRFTTITILTKNPTLAVRDGYLDLFRDLNVLPQDHSKRDLFVSKGLPGFQVEVSLAFWREEARAFYDPGAPSVEDRKLAVMALRACGIPVVLRIDPLFPRSPVAGQKNLADFGLEEAQTLGDLRGLVTFAKKIGARHLIYSPMKVIQPRRRQMTDAMVRMKDVYRAMSYPGKPVWRGGSFRLPRSIVDHDIVVPFLRICEEVGVVAKFCMASLIETP